MTFRSRRLPDHLEPNPFAARLAELRRAGADLADLTATNPTACGFPYDEAGIRAALSGPGILRYRPDARGLRAAREAVAARHGHGVDPDEVLLTASTSEAYGLLFKVLADPGDELLVPSPSYPLFEWLARLEGLAAHPVPAWFLDRWHLDLEALAAAVTPRTRAVVVVNPNNPTGAFLDRAEWEALTALCAERGLALLVDEVFADYALERPPEALPTALEDTDPPCPVFVLSGLSKVAALPQVKLGWIVARGAGARALLGDLEFAADQYLSVSSMVQEAASRLLELAVPLREAVRGRLRANLAALDAALADRPHLGRLPVGGGWSAVLRRPALDPDEACALRLLEAGAVVHPGHFFDFPRDGFLVLSLLPEEGIFRTGLERIVRTL